jgi:transposase-like protein
MNTVSEIKLTDKELNERWSRVKEDFWGDLKSQTVIALKRLLETSMEIEIQDLVGAQRWKHVTPRPTFRNGYYFRNLLTTMGLITLLKVPRLRDGKKRFKILPRYMQRSPDVDKGVLEMFLAGVSTRRVQEVLAPWMGKPTVSAGTVSKISKVLDQEVQKFHGRRLSDDYLYLVLDGIYLKTKSPIHSKRRCILVAYGIKADGTREMIDFKLTGKGESQVAWESFLVSLKNRGLEGNHLKLVVVDGNKGLWNAVDLVWLNVSRQRCWAHKLRNVANKIPHKIQGPCIIEASKIYKAESKEEALKAFKHWAKVWGGIVPDAVKCLEEDFEEMITFFQCPKELWIKLRTTNVIERVFREVRRRTRPISCFQNRESVERIIFAIFHRQNNLWEKDPLWKQKSGSHI